MKILWYSDSPFVPSGYGRIAEQLLPRLHHRGHEILIQSKFGHHGKPINLGYATMFGVTSRDSFEMVGTNARNYQVNAVILCVEIWAVDIPTLRKRLPRTLLIAYLPNDTEMLSKKSILHLKHIDYIIPMSNHCKKLLGRCEEIPDEKVLDVIYPAIPTVFQRMKEITQKHITGLEYDYLVGICQMSKDILRKDQIRQMWAVKKAADITGKKIGLYLHMQPAAAFDVVKAGEEIDFVDNIILPLEEAYLTGFTDIQMAQVYNAIDCLLQCSVGEGYGMPTAEAILCGTPVVGVDNTATSELMKMSFPEYLVEAKEITVFRGLYDRIASFDEMIKTLVKAIESSEKDAERGDQLRKLTEPEYVTDLWEKTLDEIYDRLVKTCKLVPARDPSFQNRMDEEIVVKI